MTNINSQKKAFTLIELLVVVAIIGILGSLAAISLQSARSRARDAKRVSDIKQIQIALELYYNDYNEYPASIANSISYGDNIFMLIVPSAPTPADGDCDDVNNSYIYATQGDNSSYTISFCLGNDTGSLLADTNKAVPGGIISIP
jgi:prepilin-type N-terminal cleavage/methylation domain-containing protein